MIIVEGPDGAGKSWLVDQIARRLQLPVAPRVVSKDTEPLVDLQRWVDDNLAAGYQPIIFDRHRLISEPIYGPLIRPGQNQSFYNRYWLAARMQEFYRIAPIIIYCLPPIGTIKINLVNDSDNKVVNPHTDAIYDMYVARMAIDYAVLPQQEGMLLPNVLVWNYTKNTDHDLDDLMEFIAGYTSYKMESN